MSVQEVTFTSSVQLQFSVVVLVVDFVVFVEIIFVFVSGRWDW